MIAGQNREIGSIHLGLHNLPQILSDEFMEYNG